MEDTITKIILKYMATKIKIRCKKYFEKKIDLLLKLNTDVVIIAYLLEAREKYYIDNDVIMAKLTKKIMNGKKAEKYYKLIPEDIQYYVQTVKICIDNKFMLQDSEGILYDMTSDNNIIGKIQPDNKIIWYDI